MSDLNGDVICIIGMHRSGTSMIARLLHQCGLYLGPEQELLGAHGGNPEGHFEHTGFLKIDDALLQHLGGSWDAPPEFRPGWESDASLKELLAEARALLATFAGKRTWGWKEPRTTILLPFWKSLVPNLRFVICVRSPLEVTGSLVERNTMPVARAAILWQRYMRAAIEDTEGCPRMFTFYDDFLTNALAQADRLLRFCGLERPADPSALAAAVRRDFRHHASDLSDLLEDQIIPTEYKLLYMGLRALSSRDSPATAQEEAPTKSANDLLRLLDAFHDQERLARLENELTERRDEVARLRKHMYDDLRANHRWAYRVYRNFIRPFRARQP